MFLGQGSLHMQVVASHKPVMKDVDNGTAPILTPLASQQQGLCIQILTLLDEILRTRLNTDDKHVRRISKRIAKLVQSSSLQDRYAVYAVRLLTVQ